MDLFECIYSRRDTRHFTGDDVPQSVLDQAFAAAHAAPSVGLSTPWRFAIVRDPKVKSQLQKLYLESRQAANQQASEKKQKSELHKSLTLAAIEQTPLGVALFCEAIPNDKYTIGVIGSRQAFQWSCACAIQNFWLALTAQGYGAGWVSIFDFKKVKDLLPVPDSWEFMGYMNVGKPATDYEGKPMLEHLGWKDRPSSPEMIHI